MTDADGGYRFVDLPAGTYLLKFALTGFSTLIREDLRLTIGFTARIDENMKVGAVEESVTVSGQSPTVDISSTSASVAFSKEILDSVPRGRDLQNVLAMAPGVTQETMDVGGSTLAQRQDTASYGVEAQPKLQYEGMNIAMGADQNTPIYFIDNSLEEVQVRTSGNDAEVSTPGVSMVAHEVGRQHLPWSVPCLVSAGRASGKQSQRLSEGPGNRRASAAQDVRSTITLRIWAAGLSGTGSGSMAATRKRRRARERLASRRIPDQTVGI